MKYNETQSESLRKPKSKALRIYRDINKKSNKKTSISYQNITR